MVTYAASVPTVNASRYNQQLCKHWSHKLEVSFTPEEGKVVFPSGAVLQLRAGAEQLDLQLTLADIAEGDTMRKVVEDHLNRFAFREGPLPFDWAIPA